MKPFSGEYYKFSEILRSKTKTAKLIAKNADRSKKKNVRKKLKISLQDLEI